jgi:hypothetical protein
MRLLSKPWWLAALAVVAVAAVVGSQALGGSEMMRSPVRRRCPPVPVASDLSTACCRATT